ncbi:hypothetical protein ACF0H5_023174 [Mactra antiquata]
MQVFAERTGEDTFACGNFCPAYVKQQKLAAKSLRMFISGRPDIIEDLVTSETSLFIDQMLIQCGTVPGFIESNVHTLVLRFTFQFLFGMEKDVDFDRMVDAISRMLLEVDEFSGSGSPIDVLPWLIYFMQ